MDVGFHWRGLYSGGHSVGIRSVSVHSIACSLRSQDNTERYDRYVFAKFQTSLKGNATHETASRTITTFLTLYIFGFLFELLLVYDALRLKNTIQVIGLCLFNLALLLYAAVQMQQIQDAVTGLQNQGEIGPDAWADSKPFLIAIPCIIALGTVQMAFIAWKLYDEFAWTIYKHISADLRMKRRYLTFQVRSLTMGLAVPY